MSITFIELLQQLDIPYVEEGHEHCRPGWIQIDCPFCSQYLKGHYRLGYNISAKYLNCWTCGPHRPIDTIMELTGLPFHKARTLIESVASEYIPDKEVIRPGKLILPKGLGPLKKAHITYLKNRGFKPDELEQLWKIQGIGMATRLSWRIFIPVIFRSEAVSWTTRSIKDAGVRYISASAEQERVNHKTLLYGEDYARHAIAVVEGPTDVWSIGPGAAATLGTGYKRSQVLKMAKYPVRVVCFDNAPDAQRRAKDLCSLLEPFPGQTYNVTLDAKDPGSASRREIRKFRSMFLE